MSREYAEGRIKEALKKTNGNAVRARQQVIAWTYEDPKLLHALTKAHLTGIVAYNIERILAGRGTAEETHTYTQESAKKSDVKDKEENFGMELLKAVAGNGGVQFGMESYSGGGQRRKKVSKSHIDAINALTKGRKSSE
ncbi:MAG: hypothetical protein CMH27_01770 [Micavibrio sp.]|nr:hypothetical protein [Micavibrio sp.]|tara:strand:+ start:2705 stop:3121 length:417 start_codon:yes stop_codon:yes gene_type:complete